MKTRKTTAIILAMAAISASAIESPNGKIRAEAGDKGIEIIYIGKGNPLPVLQIQGNRLKQIEESDIVNVGYEAIHGKRKNCTNRYRSAGYLTETGDTLELRIYDDGVAWHLPNKSDITITGATHDWLQKYTDCYEDFFPQDRTTTTGDRWGYPALFEYPEGVFGLLSESNINENSAASSMYSGLSKGEFELRPEGDGHPGWQTMVIGSIADVVESTLIADNSEECRLSDVSWIEPGVASWVYWAYNHGSNDCDIIAKYVDMARDLKLPYVLIDAEWDEMKNGKTVEDAIAYAVSQGVKPMIWYNSSVGWVNGAPGPKYRLNKPEDREREFAWCEKLGVKGVKIDFFSGDNNMNLRYMKDLLECAAKHHLTVNFHGAPIPRGWQRTWPNLVSTEAVYGAEWYNNVPTFTAKAARHNATLPFTRNVIGPMDYTPCAFSDSQHPHITSNAHELALTVLYESGIQHLADRPESIMAQPQEVRYFFTTLPSAWDDTILIDGYPGEYAVIARKKDSQWWIAGINGSDECRIVTPDFSRLVTDISDVVIYADGMEKGSWEIASKTSFPSEIKMGPRGGFVIKTIK